MNRFVVWRSSKRVLEGGISPSLMHSGSIDHVVLTFGTLIMIGWLPNDAHRATVALTIGGVRSAPISLTLSRYQRPDVTEAFRNASVNAPFKSGFVATLQLNSELHAAIKRSFSDGISVSLEMGNLNAHQWSFQCSVASIGVAVSNRVITGSVLQCLRQQLVVTQPSELKIIEALVGEPERYLNLPAHIDHAFQCESAPLVLAGWIANAARGSLFGVDAEFLDPMIPLSVCYSRRADVSAHLKSMQTEVSSDTHGFVSVVDGWQLESVRFCLVTDGEVRATPPLQFTRQLTTKTEYFGRLKQFSGESTEGVSSALARLVSKIDLGKLVNVPVVSRIIEFGPMPRIACDVSIIIPFYGDQFYLIDHLVSQRYAPDEVEWVIVCDDPKLAAQMTETIERRVGELRQRTKLLILESNVGFAQANNAAVPFATGNHLLLMNSDVFCDDFDFIRHSVALLKSSPLVGCVGFSLQFEDGTVQHDGMSFERSRWLDGLWVCEHKNKGMPQSWAEPVDIQVDAVTAALLMLRKADIQAGMIFDPSYIVGDFEDADLCLRIRERGQSVRLLRTRGLFHLERQSLRHIGDGASRGALTHVNCITFNGLWGKKLAVHAGGRA